MPELPDGRHLAEVRLCPNHKTHQNSRAQAVQPSVDTRPPISTIPRRAGNDRADKGQSHCSGNAGFPFRTRRSLLHFCRDSRKQTRGGNAPTEDSIPAAKLSEIVLPPAHCDSYSDTHAPIIRAAKPLSDPA